MTFLCTHHRNELSKNPIKALHDWQDWIHKGSEHLRCNELSRALSYFGCAFELSELLLEQPSHFIETQLKRIDRFMVSGFYLAELYRQEHQHDLEGQLLVHIHSALEQFSRHSSTLRKRLVDNIEFSALMIEQYYTRSEESAANQLVRTHPHLTHSIQLN
ncbi:MAG: hypothetical protein AAGF06_05825 [Pseudomonadota bacterium]